MHTSQHVTSFLILIPLHQDLAILWVLILEIEDVECCSTFVGTATLCLDLLDLDLVLISCTFLVHKLPPFHVTVILLYSILVKLLRLKFTYLFFSILSRRCLCCCSLIYLSYEAKSRLNLSLSGKKCDDVGSGLFNNALSMYLWYEPILSLSLICSTLSLSF